MKRWRQGIFVLAILGVFAAGFWYINTPAEKTREAPDKSVEYFLPDDPQLVLQFNHTERSLRNLGKVEMIRRFKESRFSGSFEKRIRPLLKLVTNQYKANTPYPSKQLLGYFRQSVSYLYQARNKQPVFVMTPGRAERDDKQKQLRDLLEEWILEPARNRNAWTVNAQTFRDVPVWRLTYSFPDNDLEVNFTFTTISEKLLISPSIRAINGSLQRYFDRQTPAYRLSKNNDDQIVDFLVTQHSPDNDTPLLSRNTGAIKMGSPRTLQGSVSVREPYLKVNARASLHDTLPVNNTSMPEDLLEYFPSRSYAVNVISVPSISGDVADHYRDLFARVGVTVLPDRLELSSVIQSLDVLNLIQPESVLSFSSFQQNASGEQTSGSSFVIAMNPTNRQAVRNSLEELYPEDQEASHDGVTRLKIGPVTASSLWDGSVLLISNSASALRRAVERRQRSEGFPHHSGFEQIEPLVPDRFTSFSYFSSAPLADALNNAPPIENARYQLAKSLLGFDPVQEVGTLVNGIPGNVLVTQHHPRNRNVSLQFYTAGDIFLPLALNRLNPETNFSYEDLPRTLKVE